MSLSKVNALYERYYRFVFPAIAVVTGLLYVLFGLKVAIWGMTGMIVTDMLLFVAMVIYAIKNRGK